jgi:hypothetical protein
MADNNLMNSSNHLLIDVCSIIDSARKHLATYANSEIIMTNWQVGMRIKEDVLNNERAEYGKQVIKRLAIKLTEKYGKGWSYYKLQHCVRSAYTFTHDEIVYAVRTQLT